MRPRFFLITTKMGMGMASFSSDESRWSLSGVEVPVGFVTRKIRHSIPPFVPL